MLRSGSADCEFKNDYKADYQSTKRNLIINQKDNLAKSGFSIQKDISYKGTSLKLFTNKARSIIQGQRMKQELFGIQQQKDITLYLEQNDRERRQENDTFNKALNAIKSTLYVNSALIFDEELHFEDIQEIFLKSLKLEKYQIGSNILTSKLREEQQNLSQSIIQNGLKQYRKWSSLKDSDQGQIKIYGPGEAIVSSNQQYFQGLRQVIASNGENQITQVQDNDELDENFIYLATLNSEQYQQVLADFEQKKTQIIIDQLKGIELFCGQNNDKLSYIVNTSVLQNFKKRGVVYREGIDASDIFVVLYGDFVMTSKQEDKEQEKIEYNQDGIKAMQQIQQSISGQGIRLIKRKIVKKIHKNQIFGELEILKGQDRVYAVSCQSEEGLLLRIHKNQYLDIVESNRNKSNSQDLCLSNESPTLENGDFFVRQHFTKSDMKNKELNSMPQMMLSSDMQGSQSMFSSKISPKRQFTKLQISQMQNNSAAITQFSKTNKQLSNILNTKLQSQSNNLSCNLQLSNGLITNKQSEDSGSGSNKNKKFNLQLHQFNSANFSQGQLSNNSSKCFSPLVSNHDIHDQSPSKMKSSQFRVRKYQSERQIEISNQSERKEQEEDLIPNQKLKEDGLRNNVNDLMQTKQSSREKQEQSQRIKSNSQDIGQGKNQGIFQLRMKLNYGNPIKQENSNALQQQQLSGLRHLSEMIAPSIEALPSTSQRGFQSPSKTNFSPNMPLRRTFIIEQSPITFKKRGFKGNSVSSINTVNYTQQVQNEKKLNKINSQEFNYPASDVVEGDTQKNTGESPLQTFSNAVQNQNNFNNGFQKKASFNEIAPKMSVSDALGKQTSKISLQYRKKPSQVVTGSCNDLQTLKNIDADELSKQIQANLNTQLSNKFSGKNSSAIFFTNNFDKSPLSSQQNLPSGKSTAATKLQVSLSNQTSPKKKFIVKKSSQQNPSQKSNQLVTSIHHIATNNDGEIQNKQGELNTDSSLFGESNDSSFMMYDDFANQMANSNNQATQAPQEVQNERQQVANEAAINQPKKLKPAIPILDLKSLGNENSQINNFFGNNNANQNHLGQNSNTNGVVPSKSQGNMLNYKQSDNIGQQEQVNQKGKPQLQRQQSLNIRPSTPSIKKLDLTNLNEQIKKSTPVNIQKEEGFNEIQQSRLILPTFNSNPLPIQNNLETTTPQNTKFDFFSPNKMANDRKAFDLNIFQTTSQAQNNILGLYQTNSVKSKQNINSLYQGLLTSQNCKTKTQQNISRKNTMNIQEYI